MWWSEACCSLVYGCFVTFRFVGFGLFLILLVCNWRRLCVCDLFGFSLGLSMLRLRFVSECLWGGD